MDNQSSFIIFCPRPILQPQNILLQNQIVAISGATTLLRGTKRGEGGTHHGMDQPANGKAKDMDATMRDGRTQIAMKAGLGWCHHFILTSVLTYLKLEFSNKLKLKSLCALKLKSSNACNEIEIWLGVFEYCRPSIVICHRQLWTISLKAMPITIPLYCKIHYDCLVD